MLKIKKITKGEDACGSSRSPRARLQVLTKRQRCVAMFMPRSIYMVVQKSSKSGEVCSFLAN